MKCNQCGHEAEIDEFASHAVNTLGLEKWNEDGPTFLCHECGKNPKQEGD